MAKILLGVTGSVAAIKTPELFDLLETLGHHVRIVATSPATYFFDPLAIRPIQGSRNPDVVTLDADEWPNSRYHRGESVLHIELRRWADTFVIAPLDANTLAKLALGICDNCLTCVWRAWDFRKPLILAPAMNTLMWQHPITRRHFATLAEDFDVSSPNPRRTLAEIIAEINSQSPILRIVSPVEKELACGDVGLGGMAPLQAIAATLQDALARSEHHSMLE
jgi:phosphopantothenoylcysteine decarboxylase